MPRSDWRPGSIRRLPGVARGARLRNAAPISVVLRGMGSGSSSTSTAKPPGPSETTDLVYALLTIPSAGEVTLGFSFREAVDAAVLEERLPPALARHAAVALTLVTEALATERDLARMRAVESQRAQFVSTVAHELRTPLTGLSGYLDLILDGRVGDPEVEREFMERGRTIVSSMAALVDDLLELSRIESGTLVLEQEPFSVADALNAVSAGLMPIALDRGVRLVVSAPPRLRSATGDRRRVEQIVTNLAANAIKFAGDRAVELVGWFEGPVAVIAVRDEGPGIAPERPRADLRTLLPDVRSRTDHWDRAGPAHCTRPRPGDGWRARRRERAGHRLELRAGPAGAGRDDPSGRDRRGQPCGARPRGRASADAGAAASRCCGRRPGSSPDTASSTMVDATVRPPPTAMAWTDPARTTHPRPSRVAEASYPRIPRHRGRVRG